MTSPTGTPAERTELEGCLRALLPAVDAVDSTEPKDAAAQLNRALPFDGPAVTRIFGLCEHGLDGGWLVPHPAGPHVRYGRFHKDLGGYAIDAVVMENAQGRGHTHTRGEINMCFPLNGVTRFDGLAPGWVVFAPGSHHVPTVTGGTMLFLYFTPGGEVVWDGASAK